MKNNQKNQQDIDPGVLEKISLLEKTPERDPELAARSRGKFLSEVENLPLTGSTSALGWLLGLFTSSYKDNTSLSIGKRKFTLSTIAAILFVVVVLFGGASATAYASQSALPGDALYPVKTSLEQTQITLANDAYNQAQLHLEFAQRRLNEIKELLSQGRTNDVEFASSEFEYYIQEAMKASQIVQAADPQRGFELNKLVSQALLDYASALKSVLVSAPEAVKPVVEKALLASQDGAGEEVEIFGVVASITDTDIEIEGVIYSITGLTEFEDFIQPGDMVKLHVIVTRDGVMVVREIELSGATEDHSNQSGDDNSNEAFDGNDNENESDDGDVNENESDDDDINENESDDDLNENGIHDNESEDHSNENDSDDSSNENESDDEENENDNEHSNENSDEDNSNESEEDDNENSNESEENSNESEEEDNKNGDD